MAKGLEAGRQFLTNVLGKITDPDLRAAAERLMADATFTTEIGNGALGQSEIDRQLQELRGKTDDLTTKATELAEKEATLATWHQSMTDWRSQKEQELAELKQRRDGTFTGEVKKPAVAATSGLSKDDLDSTIVGEREAFLGFQVESNRLQREHFDHFGKILDIEPLLKHPKIREIGLAGVYQDVHKDALAAKQQEREKAAEERIRADERAKFTAQNQSMPYLSPTGVGSGSPLDNLAATPGTVPVDVVGAASAEYARLAAARGTSA